MKMPDFTSGVLLKSSEDEMRTQREVRAWDGDRTADA